MSNRSSRRHPKKASANIVSLPAKSTRKAKQTGGVLVAYIPMNTVTTSFQRSYQELLKYDTEIGPLIAFDTIARTGGPLALPSTRNQVCQNFLKTEAEWLFLIDTDMGFKPDSLAVLLTVADPEERPIVGGLCFSMHERMDDGYNGLYTYPSPTIFNWSETDGSKYRFEGREHYPVNTMIKVGATGTAFLLIHRSVIEKIGSNWFSQKVGEDGETQGEDISFCARCREHEIPIWIHTGVRTTHMKTVWLSEEDFWESRLAPPARERVDVIIPTLGKRPANIARLLTSLMASTGLAQAWYVIEEGDKATERAVKRLGGNVIVENGSFAHKVNYAYRWIAEHGEPAPWVLLVGDDVSFQPGWFDQAVDVADRWNGSVIATNDLMNPRVMRGEHATHPMIRRSYIEETGSSFDGPGVVCHEGYIHCFVDDEITLAAKARRVFQAALGSYVSHHHPIGGKVQTDEVYEKGNASFAVDQKLFQNRVRAVSEGRLAPPPAAVQSTSDAVGTEQQLLQPS